MQAVPAATVSKTKTNEPFQKTQVNFGFRNCYLGLIEYQLSTNLLTYTGQQQKASWHI